MEAKRRYEGEVDDDCRPHGRGILTEPDGERYEGEFQDGKRNGEGVGTWPTGERYEGEWHSGMPHGEGVLTWPGLRIEGEWCYGWHYEGQLDDDADRYGNLRPHGEGVMTWTTGSTGMIPMSRFLSERGPDGGRWTTGARYEGEWYCGEPDGYGVMTWPDGGCIEGEWHCGRHYEGEVDDEGEPHGEGVITWTTGARYEGEVDADGYPHGHGVKTYPDGARKEGEFRNGEMHGHGVYTWPDGHRFKGEWRDGQRHGTFTVTEPDGTRYEGEWRDNWKRGTFKVTAPRPMIADDVAEALERCVGTEGPFRLDAHPALSEATVERGEPERDPGFTRYEFADGSAIVVFEGQWAVELESRSRISGRLSAVLEGEWAVGVPVSRLEKAQRALLLEDPELPADMARFVPEDLIHYPPVAGGSGRSAW